MSLMDESIFILHFVMLKYCLKEGGWPLLADSCHRISGGFVQEYCTPVAKMDLFRQIP
jgi:hypothetical protein